jgi:hypothetical protein
MRRRHPMWEPFYPKQRGRSSDLIEVGKQLFQVSLSSLFTTFSLASLHAVERREGRSTQRRLMPSVISESSRPVARPRL